MLHLKQIMKEKEGISVVYILQPYSTQVPMAEHICHHTCRQILQLLSSVALHVGKLYLSVIKLTAYCTSVNQAEISPVAAILNTGGTEMTKSQLNMIEIDNTVLMGDLFQTKSLLQSINVQLTKSATFIQAPICSESRYEAVKKNVTSECNQFPQCTAKVDCLALLIQKKQFDSFSPLKIIENTGLMKVCHRHIFADEFECVSWKNTQIVSTP